MNRIDLLDLLDEERFVPFRITTRQGFSVSVASHEDLKNVLAGKNQLVLMDATGYLTHIPYSAIEQITDLQPL